MNAEALLERPNEIIKSQLSHALKAAGDVLRLQVLAALAQESFGVLELSHVFGTKQSGMSHHLKVLASASLVSTRREGNTIFYRRSDSPCCDELRDLRQAIFTAANSVCLDESYQENLKTVHSARSEASRAFFIDNASAFKEQQDLIAAFDVYGSEVAKVLENSHYPSYDMAAEIGPGIGEFLPELGKHFSRVIALDTSEAMLQQSERYCTQLNVSNVDFIHSDTGHFSAIPSSLDCVVINMVLHHTPSPSEIFADTANSLKKGGVFIVCDLGAHNQDWVRQACGDQWLGFEVTDLKKWAAGCQLAEGVSHYFALRNGFQIQIHQFIKM